MAAITVDAENVALVKSIEVIEGLVAGEAITAGNYVRIDGTTGKLVKGSAVTGGADIGNQRGIALKTVASGEPVTALKRGIVDLGKSALTGNYDAAVYLSDTEGGLDTAAGTVSSVVGYITSGPATGATAYDKLLYVAL